MSITMLMMMLLMMIITTTMIMLVVMKDHTKILKEAVRLLVP